MGGWWKRKKGKQNKAKNPRRLAPTFIIHFCLSVTIFALYDFRVSAVRVPWVWLGARKSCNCTSNYSSYNCNSNTNSQRELQLANILGASCFSGGIVTFSPHFCANYRGRTRLQTVHSTWQQPKTNLRPRTTNRQPENDHNRRGQQKKWNKNQERKSAIFQLIDYKIPVTQLVGLPGRNIKLVLNCWVFEEEKL